jgi:hypothetical protein
LEQDEHTSEFLNPVVKVLIKRILYFRFVPFKIIPLNIPLKKGYLIVKTLLRNNFIFSIAQ